MFGSLMIGSLVQALRHTPGLRQSVGTYRAWRSAAIERWLRIETGSTHYDSNVPLTHFGDAFG